MGFKTTVTRAHSETKSLRTTVPSGIVTHFKLKNGDRLDWTLKAENGKIIIIVKPEK